MLKSEGTADVPTYTMGNAQPTRWLPTDLTANAPVGIAAGNMDQFTAQKSATDAVPVGIVMKVQVGRNLGRPIAYLNPGETVVRGPLNYPQFTIHWLCWLSAAGVTNTNWLGGLAPDKLMPVRPYQPASQADFDNWWNNDMATWRAEMQLVGANMVYTPSPTLWQKLGGWF